MGGDAKVIGFATTICLVCSLLLSGVYSALKPRQDVNAENDLRSKVLQAFGVEVTNAKGKHLMTSAEISALFDKTIEDRVIDADGNLIEGKKVSELSKEDINNRDAITKLKRYYPYFIYKNPETGETRYAIHVSGMGLWSVVKGYLAIESDLSTIAGLAIYDHLETPGLGGEVEKAWFLDQFKNKKLKVDNEVKYFRVLKPSAVADDSSVNGPSGATMTSNGMTSFINSDFAVYDKHFSALKGS